MIDDQNPGVSAGEQPEEANIPQEPSAPAAEDRPEENPSAAEVDSPVSEDRAAEPVPSVEQAAGQIMEGVKAVSEISETVVETPEAVPENVEAPVPSVEEPVYPEQAPAPESAPVSQAPAFSAPYAEPFQGGQEAAPGYAVPQQGMDPQMGAVPPGVPTAQAAPEFISQGMPAQENWSPQGGPVYQQPYPYTGYAPYQQAPYSSYPYGQPVPPAQNSYAAPQQQVQGQNTAPYQPAAPQQGYYAPPAGWGYPTQAPYSYGAAPRAPKKKMSVGLKVFIWIASILAGAAILGFGAYLIYHAASEQPQYPYGNLPYGYHQIPGLPGGNDDDDGIPDFDDGVTPPEADEDAKKPDVDVTPNNDGITLQDKPKGVELSAQDVYEKVVKSTVTVAVTLKRDGQEQNSTGTGIIATSDGYIITNSHVVLNSKSSTVEITTYDGQQYEAVVVGVDRTTDLAVLKTNDHQFTPAEFGDADQLAIGDSVVAIGNPGGAKFSGSMTGGYVSGLNREVGRYSENGMTYIQTDAAINPGNSGGPLVNMYGQVVGINSSKIITDGYEGMGFAIPVSKAKSVIDVLLSGGYVEGRTRLGITGTEINEMQASIYGMPRGFMIREINEESAFTGTDAQTGDIITAMDGEVVTGLNDISNLLTRYEPGDKVTITLYRQGRGEIEVEATLLEDKGETQE